MRAIVQHFPAGPEICLAPAARPLDGAVIDVAGADRRTTGHGASGEGMDLMGDNGFQPGLSVIILRRDGMEKPGLALWNRRSGFRVLERISGQ